MNTYRVTAAGILSLTVNARSYAEAAQKFVNDHSTCGDNVFLAPNHEEGNYRTDYGVDLWVELV